MKFDLRYVSAKKRKKTKKACILFKNIFIKKSIFCLYFSPVGNLWSRKAVSFNFFEVVQDLNQIVYSNIRSDFCDFTKSISKGTKILNAWK